MKQKRRSLLYSSSSPFIPSRKEAAERLQLKVAEDIKLKLAAAGEQSSRAITALMNELSAYGDAVQSEIDKVK